MNTSTTQLRSLIEQITQGAGGAPENLAPILNQLIELISALAKGGHPLDGLKKTGAWRDMPLACNSADKPYYVTVPNTLDVVNLTPAQLAIALKQPEAQPRPDGYGNSVITIPAPLLNR